MSALTDAETAAHSAAAAIDAALASLEAAIPDFVAAITAGHTATEEPSGPMGHRPSNNWRWRTPYDHIAAVAVRKPNVAKALWSWRRQHRRSEHPGEPVSRLISPCAKMPPCTSCGRRLRSSTMR